MKVLAQALSLILLLLTLCVSIGYCAASEREISKKEARDLLTTFLNLPNACLIKSGEMDYAGFYYFMAVLGASSNGVGGVGILNVRYYAVDRQTGEVWNAVVCQRITSEKLRKLQAGLRKSIGLTDSEDRKIGRQGPFCEPGMPCVRDGK